MASPDLSKLRLDKSGNGKHQGGRPHRRKLVVAIVAVVLLTAYLIASPRVVEVETATVSKVYPSQSLTLLSASGYVVAQRRAAVSSKATGRLDWLGVEEGSHVQRGEVIARLESGDVRAAEAQAEANVLVAKAGLADAQQNYDRMKELRSKGYVAQADFDTADIQLRRAQASVQASDAALRAAQVAVEYTLIRAPFDAVVLTKDADVGDIVTPFGAAANAKASVVTIADMSSLQVEVDVSESNLEKVKVGQPCEIQLDALPDERFRGSVHMIVPTADRSKASVMVKIRFAKRDPRVLPEMSARVAFLSRPVSQDEETPLIAVDPAAIRTGKKGPEMFVVKDNRAVETPVVPGRKLGDLVEVSGVAAGSQVVLNPPAKLRNGTRVKRKEQ